MRTIPTILIHQPDADAEEAYSQSEDSANSSESRPRRRRRYSQADNDPSALPLARRRSNRTRRDLIATLLLNHLVHDAAAAKNHVR